MSNTSTLLKLCQWWKTQSSWQFDIVKWFNFDYRYTWLLWWVDTCFCRSTLPLHQMPLDRITSPFVNLITTSFKRIICHMDWSRNAITLIPSANCSCNLLSNRRLLSVAWLLKTEKCVFLMKSLFADLNKISFKEFPYRDVVDS